MDPSPYSDESSDDEHGGDVLIYYCDICNKHYRSEGQLASHERSKKHLQALKALRKEEEDELMHKEEHGGGLHRGKTKYFKMLVGPHKRIDRLQKLIETQKSTLNEKDMVISEKDKAIQERDSVIQAKGATLESLEQASAFKNTVIAGLRRTIRTCESSIHSLESENDRLGRQNAALDGAQLRGDRLQHISAAELSCLVGNINAEMTRLTQLKAAAESQRVEAERAEQERERVCMACWSEPKAVKLPCGCTCYCASCHKRILAGGRGEMDGQPEPKPRCPLCRKPF
ncbi:unnamed protein product [Vitrella brassicaformis CCMP3155]|uniref:C2H2-type domain-containing protein n=1 Tax=Vitrella brassicaformis (strain CCMP3155) TaxID=1169540 RepID=A0A0G4FZ48_VITBC|nr:unnamed protein product [Vitrella brassicaformis CCMP3155]|eukprot:CEM20895.1 unnamed protein product [Vitrella brassicaformis CCMP3155]